MNWHYTIEGKTFGPVPEAELQKLLQNGAISNDTLVWKEGMAGWEPYEKVIGGAPAQAVSAAAATSVPAPEKIAAQPKPIVAPTPEGAARAATGLPEEHGACVECGAVLPVWKLTYTAAGRLCRDCEAKAALPPLPSRGTASKYRGNFAGFWLRAFARILDIVVILLLAGGISVALFAFKVETLWAEVAAAAVPIIYFTLCVGSSSTTLGKRIFRLHVVTPDGYPFGYLRALWRVFAEILGLAPGVILAYFLEQHGVTAGWENASAWGALAIPLWVILYYGFVLVNPDKRALHDYLAGTRVIKERF